MAELTNQQILDYKCMPYEAVVVYVQELGQHE